MVTLDRPFAEGEVAAVLARPGVRSAAARLPTDDEAEALIARLATGPKSVSALLAEVPADRRPFVERGIVWLAKFGMLRTVQGSYVVVMSSSQVSDTQMHGEYID
eukprot:gene7560-10204_t